MPDNHYATDLTDAIWELLAPLLPAARPCGRPRTTEMRNVINAIFICCAPAVSSAFFPEFPAWGTLYHYFGCGRIPAGGLAFNKRSTSKLAGKRADPCAPRW